MAEDKEIIEKKRRQEWEKRKGAAYCYSFNRLHNNQKLYLSYLKPCPFCNDKEMLRFLPHEHKCGNITYQTWEVQCQTCYCSKRIVTTEVEEVLLSWNRRFNEPASELWDYWDFCRELRKKGVKFPKGYFPK